MSGQIFISYRRDDSSGWAGRLYDSLNRHFVSNQIFIDVDNLEPGTDFVEAIKSSVGSCDVLITVIGKRWLISSDEDGKRRLDNPDDFVRLEIATALDRKIRVIPVLVDGASMPRSDDLPDDMKLLTRRNALDVSHSRFNADSGRLIAVVERVLEKIETEKKRLVAVLRRREANLRWEAEQREKERLDSEPEKQRLAAQQREKERVEAEQRERLQRVEEEHLKAEKHQQERLEAQARQDTETDRQNAERTAKERPDPDRSVDGRGAKDQTTPTRSKLATKVSAVRLVSVLYFFLCIFLVGIAISNIGTPLWGWVGMLALIVVGLILGLVGVRLWKCTIQKK